MIIKKVK